MLSLVDDDGGDDDDEVDQDDDDDNDLETLNGRQTEPGRCVKL